MEKGSFDFGAVLSDVAGAVAGVFGANANARAAAAQANATNAAAAGLAASDQAKLQLVLTAGVMLIVGVLLIRKFG